MKASENKKKIKKISSVIYNCAHILEYQNENQNHKKGEQKVLLFTWNGTNNVWRKKMARVVVGDERKETFVVDIFAKQISDDV